MVNAVSVNEIRAKLEETIGPVFYSDLRAHIVRGGLLIVDPALLLIDAGLAIATDDSTRVAQWIEKGWLRRPSEAEVASWSQNPERKWLAIVVQPYALAQAMD
jgi:hypothetical protein